jgi:hypothetical protein
MIEVKESLEHLSDQFNIKYCAIYVIQVKKWSTIILKLFLYRVTFNGIFSIIQRLKGVRISSVLCADPLPERRRKKYINFL